jgi:hypothetical protein
LPLPCYVVVLYETYQTQKPFTNQCGKSGSSMGSPQGCTGESTFSIMPHEAPWSFGADTFRVTNIGVEKASNARASRKAALSFNLSPPFIFPLEHNWSRMRLQQDSLAFAYHISTIHDSESDRKEGLKKEREEKGEQTVAVAHQEAERFRFC